MLLVLDSPYTSWLLYVLCSEDCLNLNLDFSDSSTLLCASASLSTASFTKPQVAWSTDTFDAKLLANS